MNDVFLDTIGLIAVWDAEISGTQRRMAPTGNCCCKSGVW